MNLYDKIQETTQYILQKISYSPQTGIILGSGLTGLTSILTDKILIKYEEIPHFPVATVEGHSGELIIGKLYDKHVIMLSGRFHYYEGYSMEQVTFPVRVFKELGVDTLIVSNASGGTNSTYNVGDIVLITDHINLFPEHPLRGRNDSRLGTRFPDMSAAYDKELIALATQIAEELQINVKKGVYVGLQGPTFETPAEYKWLQKIGGDAVGMSTVPEVIVARHGGMRVFAISVIADIGVCETPIPVSHADVLAAANSESEKMATLVQHLIQRIPVHAPQATSLH